MTETVLPPSDHYCNEEVAPSGDHYCIDIVLPSSDHCCTETAPPSSDHCGTTNVAPPTDHLYECMYGVSRRYDGSRPQSVLVLACVRLWLCRPISEAKSWPQT